MHMDQTVRISLPISSFLRPVFRISSRIVQCIRACVGVCVRSSRDTEPSRADATDPTAAAQTVVN